MNKWHLYDLRTGLFTGRVVLSDQAVTPPEGCGAVQWPAGEALPAHARRVDLATGQVEPWQPAAPPNDELRTWAWDDAAERWRPVATDAALQRQREVELRVQLEARELAQARPQRELLLALAEGKAAPAEAVARLAEIEADAVAMRLELRAAARRNNP